MGLFRSLADFTFSRFVTTDIVRLLYILSIAWHALVALAIAVSGFTQDVAVGLLGLFVSPVYFFLAVLFSRVVLEIVVVVFRIADYLRDMRGSRGADTWSRSSTATQRS